MRRRLPFLAVWIFAACYVGLRLTHHWVALDEGEIGQAVDRVLAGQLPHRDFDDIWTGGLAELHAVIYRLTVPSLVALRVALYLVFLAWVPAVYALARRVAEPAPAALATLLAVVWSLPNYVAAVPNWYLLFLATFGALAITRYVDTRHARWLVLAGVCGGIGITFKIIGVYYVGAVLLSLFLLDQARGLSKGRWYTALVTVPLTLVPLGVRWLVSHTPSDDGGALLQFVLPVAMLAALLIRREWRAAGTRQWRERLTSQLRMVLPFLAGVAAPILMFLVPYIRSHSVPALVAGVLVNPQRRFTFAAVAPPGLSTILPALAWAPVLIPFTVRRPRVVAAIVALALAVVLWLSRDGGDAYAAASLMVAHAAWCVVLAGVVLLWRDAIDPSRQWFVFLMLALTALWGLVRVPYAVPTYVFYFAPFSILAVLSIMSTRRQGVGPVSLPFAIASAVFGILLVNPGHYTADGDRIRTRDNTLLPIARTGLIVPAREAAQYAALDAIVRARIPDGAPIYAGPDCPEVFYLTRHPNPTRTLLDFLDDPARHDRLAIQAIERPDVRGAVVYNTPHQSAPIDPAIARAVRERFPDSAVAGAFTVRW